jgi:arylsulfatase A-like enzyme
MPPMSTLRLIAFLCLSFVLAKVATVRGETPPRPNIILIVADDHGYGDVSLYHNSDTQTPNLLQLAKDGMLFTQMRANCTVCSPSRAAILTGRYPDRVGVPGVIRTSPDDSWGFFSPNVTTLPDLLRKCKYHTAAIGKWHLGLESPNLPNERGFDFFHGFLGDMMDSYTTHLRHGQNYMRLNTEVVHPSGHATEVFTDWAIEYLQQRAQVKDQPFFLYLAYNAPHFPIEPPEKWLHKVQQRDPSLTEARAKNVALVEHLDHHIGRVVSTLEQLKLAPNTLVVFTSDNGGSLPHAQNNDPWRDGKQSHYDGGLKVPFVMKWPKGIQASTQSDYQALNFDLFPTFLELAGSESPTDLDAVSLVPILKGKSLPASRELYFTRREGGIKYGGKSYEAIVYDGWKLLQNDPYSPLELYDLKNDPGETRNLIQTEKKRASDLEARLRKHIQRGGTTPWQAP